MKQRLRISKKGLLILASLSILLFSLTLSIFSKQITLVDDAWITFRVSDNLLQHGELTYNPGDRVEGISNLLWAVILALFGRVIPLELPILAVSLSLFLIACSVFRLWKIGVFLGFHPVISTIPALFLLFTPDFIGTATNGLEMPLCLFLMLETVWFFLKGKYPLVFICLGLLFLTRIETVGIALIFLLVMLVTMQPSRKKSFIVGTAIYLGMLISVTIARLLYFHDFIPNSVRAKQVGLSSGILLSGARYVMDFSNQNPVFIVLFFAALLVILHKGFQNKLKQGIQSLREEKYLQLLLISLLSILFSFVVILKNGGDWMPNYRLIILYSAFYACLLFPLLKNGTLSVILSLAILAGPLIHMSDLALARLRHEQDFALVDYSAGMNFWAEASGKLSSEVTPEDVVSAEAIGYIGYQLAGTPIHDPLGLTDPHIARSGVPAIPFGKTDIEYTYSVVKPTVMIWHYLGHLNDLDLGKVDQEYKTFCFENCESWNAHVVMIHESRLKDLGDPFANWQEIKLSELP